MLGRAGVVAAAAISTSGCSFITMEPAKKDEKPRAAKGREAPMLAALVRDGKLPPVQRRLPSSPLVVAPADDIGVYGGTWRSALLGPADNAWLGRTVGYECLMRWSPDGRRSIPNIAESIEHSSDHRGFTINLRPGMRWSDGKPITADDLMFAFIDVLLEPALTPVVPEVLRSGKTPASLVKLDDVTVRVTFREPSGLFLERMAIVLQGDLLINYPRHYLERFHPKYNPRAEAAAKAAGFAGWVQHFQNVSDPNTWANPDLPTLRPWVIDTPLGKGSRVVVRRNPYYWKTDPDGSQLPYIDRIVFDVITDPSVILLKATTGELDFHTRHINTLPNKPVLARSRRRGHYGFVTLKNTQMNEMLIALNLNHKDPALRNVFQNKDFRIGLSHAIDRKKMVTAVFQRQGRPWQAAPVEGSAYFDAEFATQYTEFDLDRANAHLDKAGYTRRDGGGFRLRPDGERIVVDIDVATPALVPFWTDALQLVTRNWEKVGVQARTQTRDRSLFFERRDANNHDATVWVGDGGYGIEPHAPAWYLPTGTEFAGLWGRWFSSQGKEGEKPPPAVRDQMARYRRMLTAGSRSERTRLFRQVLAIAREQFYVIGTIWIPETYGIVRDHFHNVPGSMPEAAVYGTPALTNPEQYYIS